MSIFTLTSVEVFRVTDPALLTDLSSLSATSKTLSRLTPVTGIDWMGSMTRENSMKLSQEGGETRVIAAAESPNVGEVATPLTFSADGEFQSLDTNIVRFALGNTYDPVTKTVAVSTNPIARGEAFIIIGKDAFGEKMGYIARNVTVRPTAPFKMDLDGEVTATLRLSFQDDADGYPLHFISTFLDKEADDASFSPAATVTIVGGAVSGEVVIENAGVSGLGPGSYVTIDGVNGPVLRLVLLGSTYRIDIVDRGASLPSGVYDIIFHRFGGSQGYPPGYNPNPGEGQQDAFLTATADNGSIVSVEAPTGLYGTGYDLSQAYATVIPSYGGADAVIQLVARPGTDGGVEAVVVDGGHSFNPPYGTHNVEVRRWGGSGNGMPPVQVDPNPGETDAYLVPQLNMMDYGVDAVTPNVAGSGYGWNSWAMVSPAIGVGITPPIREAKIRLIVESGGVIDVQVLDRGEGYTTPPQIVVMRSGGPGDGYPLGWSEGTDPGGPTDPPPQSDAEAYVVMGGDLNDEVDGVYLQMSEDNIPMSGSGYDWNTAWAEAVGDSMDKARLRIEYLDWQSGVGQLSVAHRGSGYANAPSVVFHREGGDGQGYGPGETPQDD